jgi:hypothetical protein
MTVLLGGVGRSKAGGGGALVFEGGDSFDEARDSKSVADTAGTTDEVEATTFAREGNGKFDQRGDARAVNLRDIVEVDDHLARTLIEEILGELAEVFAGLADGETAVDVKVVHAAGLARRDFQWWMKRHFNNTLSAN